MWEGSSVSNVSKRDSADKSEWMQPLGGGSRREWTPRRTGGEEYDTPRSAVERDEEVLNDMYQGPL